MDACTEQFMSRQGHRIVCGSMMSAWHGNALRITDPLWGETTLLTLYGGNSPHKGQVTRVLIFSLMLASKDSWTILRMLCIQISFGALRWRHYGCDSVSNHQPHDCLLNCLFRRTSKKTSKLRDTGLCVGNSPGTGEFPAQMTSNAENVSIWWRHHGIER